MIAYRYGCWHLIWLLGYCVSHKVDPCPARGYIQARPSGSRRVGSVWAHHRSDVPEWAHSCNPQKYWSPISSTLMKGRMLHVSSSLTLMKGGRLSSAPRHYCFAAPACARGWSGVHHRRYRCPLQRSLTIRIRSMNESDTFFFQHSVLIMTLTQRRPYLSPSQLLHKEGIVIQPANVQRVWATVSGQLCWDRVNRGCVLE